MAREEAAQLAPGQIPGGARAAIEAPARSNLLDLLGEAFQADASRFRSAVGPIERLEVLAEVLDSKSGVFEVTTP